jgi:hypothetical protein
MSWGFFADYRRMRRPRDAIHPRSNDGRGGEEEDRRGDGEQGQNSKDDPLHVSRR